MTNTQIALESMAMDLKRAAVGFHRGSLDMAKRFLKEVEKRKKEVNVKEVKPYIAEILHDLSLVFKQEDKEKKAEYALLYSILIQNYCTANY